VKGLSEGAGGGKVGGRGTGRSSAAAAMLVGKSLVLGGRAVRLTRRRRLEACVCCPGLGFRCRKSCW
jgi:hypothetical protein